MAEWGQSLKKNVSIVKDQDLPLTKPAKKKCMDSQMNIEEVQGLIEEEGNAAVSMLLSKNRKYGNSAVSPRRFFSKAETTEQIRVRIDDKLNRLTNGLSEEDEEDVVLDLIGYLILLRVAQRVQNVQVNSI